MRARADSPNSNFHAKAIAGTHTVLLALDCAEPRRQGLLGFAIQREQIGSASTGPKWLRSLKVFKSIVPDPKNAKDPANPTRQKPFYTNEFPIQSFLWGDYAASPATAYRFRILPMYGKPGALTSNAQDEVKVEITTEKEWDAAERHGIWFNRGAIASQKFAEEFGNKPPHDINDPKDKTVVWLSRGLLEACLNYINSTPAGDGLRVAAYEFTYPPILKALKAARDRGVHVQIVYHDTSGDKGTPNETAMKANGLPVNDQVFTFRRSKTKIPHNKFIVRLKNNTDPVEVWTGSTNFTSSGFLGQTNVGHRIADPVTAKQYLDFWMLVKTDPELAAARARTATLTPDPPEVIAPGSVARLFSPRANASMLDYYGRRMLDAVNSVWFTAAFGVTAKLVPPLAQKRDQMRFVLLEKPATDVNRKALTVDFTRVILSYGVPLGELYRSRMASRPRASRSRNSSSTSGSSWKSSSAPANDGFVFFVHTKFLLIDPLSDDPLVISGSANFSPPSLTANDENMLLIRGSTRCADIYMTEFDRVFRHFYFRDIANELAASKPGDGELAIFLDETSNWTAAYFTAGKVKNNRRLMFFAKPAKTWSGNAAAAPASPVAGNKPRAKKKPAGGKSTAKKKPAAKASGAARRKRKLPPRRKLPLRKRRNPRPKEKSGANAVAVRTL